MSESLVTLKKVSKQFVLNDQTEENSFKIIVSFLKKRKQALNNINLKVESGELIGIIGKKDSGKTILLKIISGIILPTEGFVKVSKTVYPVIDNSKACFHHELTGKESIFLFGSLLGVKWKKIESKFSEIVNFLEMGSIANKKIKHYSQNVVNKIALTTAMFLDPEILLVDSVIPQEKLFLEKVYQKLRKLKQAGVAVLIASESLNMIKDLCDRYILLNKGNLVRDSYFDGLRSDKNIENSLVAAT